jgi:hypothetical protein
MLSIRYLLHIAKTLVALTLLLSSPLFAQTEQYTVVTSAKKMGIDFNKSVEINYELKGQGEFPEQESVIKTLHQHGFKTNLSESRQTKTVDGKVNVASVKVTLEASVQGRFSEASIAKLIAEVQAKSKSQSQSAHKWSISQIK